MAETTEQQQITTLDPFSQSVLDAQEAPEPSTLDLITQAPEPQKQVAGNVVNVDLMAASMSAASDGRMSLREATIQATTDYSGKAVRDLAATLYVQQIQENRAGFEVEAARGNLVTAEMFARNIDSLQRRAAVDDPAKNTSTVVKEAVVNTVTSNEATRKNNTIKQLAKVVEEKGSDVAALEIVSQAIVDKYGKDVPGVGAIVGLFAGTIGVPMIAGAVAGGPVGGLTAAGMGAAYFYETVQKPTRIIEDVTGIVNPEKKFGVSYGYVEQRALLDAYVSTLSPKEQVATYTQIADRMLADLNPALPKSVGQLFALMNVAKLYDSISNTQWKDGDLFPTLSLKMQQTIDQLSLGLEAAGMVQAVRRLGNVTRTQGELAGGSKVGERFGADVAAKKDTPGITSADQTSVVLNTDISKVLDRTFGGTEGTEASAAQKIISERITELTKEINDKIKVSANEETQLLRDVIHRNVQAGMDGSIAHYNPTTNTLVLQHPSAAPFKTETVAKDVAKWASEQTGLKFEAIKADGSAIPKLSSLDDEMLDFSTSLDAAVQEARAFNEPLDAGWVLRSVKSDSTITHIASGKEISNVAAKEVAKMLEDGGVLKNVKVELVSDESKWADVVKSVLKGKVDEAEMQRRISGMSGLQGLYEPYSNKVYVLDRVASSPSLMLHELTHARLGGVLEVALKGDAKARTAAKLSNEQIAAAKNLDTLYKYTDGVMKERFGEQWKYYKGAGGDKAFYGFTNVHEMASEILSVSNKEFRDVLKDIPVSKVVLDEMRLNDVSITGKVRNVFDAIVHSLAKIFGFKAGNDSFTHILDQVARLAREVDVNQQNMLAQLKKGGLKKDDIKTLFGEPLASKLSHGWFVRYVGTGARHTQAEIDSVATLGADPAHTASRLAVAERFIAQQGDAKDREAFAKFVKEGFNGLSKKEMRHVEKTLEEGDTLEREFGVVDLISRGLNDKQQIAYYTYRTISNLNHVIKNNIQKTEFVNQGYARQVYLSLGGGATDTSPAKVVNLADFNGKRAYDLSTGKRVVLDSSKPPVGMSLISTYNNLTVGSADYSLFLGTSGNAKWGALLDPIPHRAGTFRRIYTDDVFAVVKRIVNVNGVDEEVETALRTARSMKDASKWAAGMSDILQAYKASPASVTQAFIESKVGKWEDATAIHKEIQLGKWDGYSTFETKFTRSNTDLVQSLAKGLHDGRRDGVRGEQRLKAIDDINRPNTLPPLNALEAEVGNVSFLKNVNEWRQKWVDTWYNTFSDLIPESVRTSGRTPLQILSDPNWQLSNYRGSDAKVKFAENQRKYILQQLGVETLSERIIKHSIEGMTSAFTEEAKLLGLPIGKPLVVAGHALRQADPLQFIRSFNFYTMLSGFNVSQLFVQAAGAGTAIAIHPIYGAKAAYMAPILRMALASDNPAVWRTMAKLDKVMNLGITNTQDFVDSVVAIRRSGLLKGIAATSMHNVEGGAFNMFGGGKEALANLGAMPFNRGEEFARLVSFDVARREWIDKNPGKAWTTDSALQAIVTRTDDYTMNMTNANKAWFQRGVWSIPGQFLQYNIKLAANLVDGLVADKRARSFDRVDSLKIMAFHTLMYGAVGVGSSYMIDEVTGGWEKVTGNKVSDDERTAISQGMLAAVVNEVSQAATGKDLKLALGSRFGVGEFYENFFRGIIRGDQSLWQTVLGPSHASIKRAFGAAGDMLLPFSRKDYSEQATLEAINDIGKGFLSSWRYATKAYVATQNSNRIMDEYGVPVATLSGPEVWFQAIGISSEVESEYYRNKRNISEHKKVIKELADSWKQAHLDYIKAKTDGDNTRAEKLLTFMSAIRPTNSGDLKLFDEQIKARDDKVFPYSDRATKMSADYLTGKYDIKDTSTSRMGVPVESK
jgi:hypothetical protein